MRKSSDIIFINLNETFYNKIGKSVFLFILFFIIPFMISCREESSSTIETEKKEIKNRILLNIPLTGSLQNPAFSPAGEWIVFTRFINGYNGEPAEIYKYNLSSGQLILLVSDGSANVNLPGSSWNGKIKKIVFSSSREPHDEIFLIGENGISNSEVRITYRKNRVAYEPTLSPDGVWVVFESHYLEQEENGIIIKYRIDKTSSYISLTKEGDDCRQPNWSPNGDKIVYQRYEGGQWDLWVMNPDGSNKKKITTGPGDKTDASFTSDGQFIVYSSDFESMLSNIYKISIAGGNPVRLTNYSGYDGAPSISPDGTKLVFESCSKNPDNSQGTKLFIFNL
jgi:TolB protein